MDSDKLKNFFVYHFEKMILVLVIAASGFLLYSGWQLPNFLDTQRPDRLTTKANEVKSSIDVDHNAQILPDRLPTFDIVKETARVDTPVDPSDYSLPQTWSGKSPNSIVRRLDPQLIAPRSLIVKPVVASIAIRGALEKDTYALALLDPADEVEKVEKPKPRENRRSRRASMMEQMMGGGGDEMMDMGMDMMSEMMDSTTSSAGAGRRFDSKFDLGVRPNATEDKRNPQPSVGWFIAGTAVVPHKELYEIFKESLQDADLYDPRRDTPFYWDLKVQRADVTDKPVDQLAEGDWVEIWNRLKYTQLAALRWSGFAPELVPSDYRDDALTMWIPPVLLDDYRSFALHPLIPMLSQKDLENAAKAGEVQEDFREFTTDMEDDLTLVAPGQRGGGTMGMMGMDYGMEMDSMGMDSMMMGMGMAMMGRGGLEANPVDYKLIRFYDFAGFKGSPQFGRKYVYRIQYAVNDPNFPFLETLQPKVSSLSPDVAQRVQGQMEKAIKDGSRDFLRWSEWSEPTEPVSLPSLEQWFAGPVDPGTINVWKVGGKDVEYTRDAPTAKIVTSQFDIVTGARIPMQLEITEGSLLSHKAESADVIDPVSLSIKKLPDAELVSGTTVVDLDGGAPLKITSDLKSPGLMLLFDQTGQLRVSDEVGDQRMYRIYSFAEERGE